MIEDTVISYRSILDSVPRFCHCCGTSDYWRSTLLQCECIVFFCQDCAKKQLANHPETYHGGVTCPICGKQTTNDIIREKDVILEIVKKNESNLIRSAIVHLKSRGMEHDRDIDVISGLVTTFGRVLSTDSIQEYSRKSDKQLKLLIARLEDNRLNSSTFSGLNGDLTLGPLRDIEFKHNIWFEKILSPDGFKGNRYDKCTSCAEVISSSVLRGCECLSGACCVRCVRSMVQSLDHDITLCLICRIKSPYIDTADAKVEVDRLVNQLFNFVPKIYKKQDVNLHFRNKELLSRCNQRKIISAQRIEDMNEARSDPHKLSLALARFELRRLELNEKFPFDKDTPPGDIDKARIDLGFDNQYLPLGPLELLKFTKDIFFELYVLLLSFSDQVQPDASHFEIQLPRKRKRNIRIDDDVDENPILRQRTVSDPISVPSAAPSSILIKKDQVSLSFDTQNTVLPLNEQPLHGDLEQKYAATSLLQITDVIEKKGNEFGMLSVIEDFCIMDENMVIICSVKELQKGYIAGNLKSKMNRENSKIKVHFTKWMIYLDSNNTFGVDESMELGDFILFGTENIVSVPKLYKLSQKAHHSFGTTMIKLRSFSSALVSIVSVVEEEERKVAPSQCMVTWQDVLQLLGDVISIPMVNKNLGIMYAQILISNKFSKDSKFIKSLAELVTSKDVARSGESSSKQAKENINKVKSMENAELEKTVRKKFVKSLNLSDSEPTKTQIKSSSSSSGTAIAKSVTSDTRQLKAVETPQPAEKPVLKASVASIKQPVPDVKVYPGYRPLENIEQKENKESTSSGTTDSSAVMNNYADPKAIAIKSRELMYKYRAINFSEYGAFRIFVKLDIDSRPMQQNGKKDDNIEIIVQLSFSSYQVTVENFRNGDENQFSMYVARDAKLSSLFTRLKGQYGISAHIDSCYNARINQPVDVNYTFGNFNIQSKTVFFVCPIFDKKVGSIFVKNELEKNNSTMNNESSNRLYESYNPPNLDIKEERRDRFDRTQNNSNHSRESLVTGGSTVFNRNSSFPSRSGEINFRREDNFETSRSRYADESPSMLSEQVFMSRDISENLDKYFPSSLIRQIERETGAYISIKFDSRSRREVFLCESHSENRLRRAKLELQKEIDYISARLQTSSIRRINDTKSSYYPDFEEDKHRYHQMHSLTEKSYSGDQYSRSFVVDNPIKAGSNDLQPSSNREESYSMTKGNENVPVLSLRPYNPALESLNAPIKRPLNPPIKPNTTTMPYHHASETSSNRFQGLDTRHLGPFCLYLEVNRIPDRNDKNFFMDKPDKATLSRCGEGSFYVLLKVILHPINRSSSADEIRSDDPSNPWIKINMVQFANVPLKKLKNLIIDQLGMRVDIAHTKAFNSRFDYLRESYSLYNLRLEVGAKCYLSPIS